ncbi:MAG: hypothetical protein LUE63_04805 [Lachnospiraceae bacterium]|nr:hypothetical protein [Lachnospiraceae bacterium]
MEKKALILLDPDGSYVERFQEQTGKRRTFPLETVGFTGWDEMREALPRYPTAALLVESGCWREQPEEEQNALRERNVPLFLLSRDPGEGAGEVPSIYKYQSLEEILGKILEGLEELPAAGPKGRTRFLGVYSPLGRCGKSTCALLLAQILAERETILYVNLETLAGFTPPEEVMITRTLSDLLYLRRLPGKEDGVFHGAMGMVGSPEILYPVVNPEDLWELPTEELAEVIQAIGEEKACDTVVLDLESGRNPLPLLRLCQRILEPVREDPMSVGRLEAFRAYLQQRGEEEVQAACREVALPECAGWEGELSELHSLRHSPLGDFLVKELASW